MFSKKHIFLLVFMISSLSGTLWANSCFPENSLRFESEQTYKHKYQVKYSFEMSVDHFKFMMQDLVLPRDLQIKIDWDNDKVNASITRDDDNNPIINIYGGILRHPFMNEEGLVALLCHELGHYLGGAPRKFRGRSSKRSWMSAEGQADYFAGSKCLKRVFDEDCQSYTGCPKSVIGAETLTRIFANVKGYSSWPTVFKKDNSTVYSILYAHGTPQCRLDTILAGVNCHKGTEEMFDPTDERVGACLDTSSQRPKCWYP